MYLREGFKVTKVECIDAHKKEFVSPLASSVLSHHVRATEFLLCGRYTNKAPHHLGSKGQACTSYQAHWISA